MTKKLKWRHIGIAAMGDKHGPAHVYSATYKCSAITRMRRYNSTRQQFTVSGEGTHRTLAAARAEIDRKCR